MKHPLTLSRLLTLLGWSSPKFARLEENTDTQDKTDRSGLPIPRRDRCDTCRLL
jgi:hypothetical protein